tara:strand:- start:2346 stop:2591 length:246 start_codon:yes stop_codon:yes gene_type:complete
MYLRSRAPHRSASRVLLVVSSLFIITMPDMMSPMAGNIMFSDWQGMIWNVPLLGVVIGGALWALFAGVLGWLIAYCKYWQL